MRCNVRRGGLAVLWFAAAILSAPRAGAQEVEPFDRAAPYLIVGGGYSFENFSGTDPLSIDETPNVITHAGWRINPYFAVDVGFEWNPGFETKFEGNKAELETYFTTVGVKIYALKGRFKPFVHPSVGVMVAKTSTNVEGVGDDTTTTPGLRGGGGIEVHISENLFLYSAAYYVLPFDNDVKDAQYIPVVGGIGWRF